MSAKGEALLSVNFDKQEMVDGDGELGFAFALPASPAWADRLATGVLSGPGGTATLRRDPWTGHMRGFLCDLASFDGGRGMLAGAAVSPASIASTPPEAADLDVPISRDLRPAHQWMR